MQLYLCTYKIEKLPRWGLSSNPDCSFCLGSETLLHVVAGCQSCLDRFIWRHNSVLYFLAETLLPPQADYRIFADLPGLNNPSIITGERCRPDLLLIYLDRYTWRHDSILQFISNNLSSQHIQNIYADLPSFPNPSVITGDHFRPDLLILTKDNCLYILELTVGYETNLRNK